jgi:hypothetical protein
MSCRRDSRVMKHGLILPSLLLAGCGRSPSFNVAGSLFPAWLLCLIVAMLLTVLAQWISLRLQIALAPPILIYPSLTAAFAFALWLIFFR